MSVFLYSTRVGVGGHVIKKIVLRAQLPKHVRNSLLQVSYRICLSLTGLSYPSGRQLTLRKIAIWMSKNCPKKIAISPKKLLKMFWQFSEKKMAKTFLVIFYIQMVIFRRVIILQKIE